MRAPRRPPARPARDTVGGRSAGMQTRRPMPARLSVCGRARRGQAHNGELGYGASGKKSSANPDKCSALEGVRVHQARPRAPAAAPGLPALLRAGLRAGRRHGRGLADLAALRAQVALGVGHGLFLADPEHAAVKAAEVFTPAVLEEQAPAAPEPAAGKGAHGHHSARARSRLWAAYACGCARARLVRALLAEAHGVRRRSSQGQGRGPRRQAQGGRAAGQGEEGEMRPAAAYSQSCMRPGHPFST